ncbi:GNAT family N-acetyltransferase [Shewanella surugensis]|uniref:GNAT family N-acetyltransferase n=1 Tax=Shewanella surugensis TaxID=212020 RepID=A0ABT0LEX9_9GAMM|nr:GNAT family N-acetyltransferase [Shewanella surugensis]MCL1126259.1 GNAT family N-acetyltransferase [Shewanella surugensis]
MKEVNLPNVLIKIKKISWKETLPIRHQVLWPNKVASFCKVSGDESALHYGAYIDNDLISVASLFFVEWRVQLRKFATLAEYQGQGFGSLLLTHMIGVAKGLGADYFWCDARRNAVAFYARFGMTVKGDDFMKSGVIFCQMEMAL